MSALRVRGVDALTSKYRQVCEYVRRDAQSAYRSPLHQLDTNALSSAVSETLGGEDAFRSRMVSDKAYRKLVDVFIRTVERLQTPRRNIKF